MGIDMVMVHEKVISADWILHILKLLANGVLLVAVCFHQVWTAAFRSNSIILEKKNMAGGADSAQYRRLCYRLAWLPRWCLRRSSWTLLLQAHRERGFCFPISSLVFWERRVCDLKTWNLCMRKFPSETATFQSNGLTWSEFETVVSNEQVWLGTLGYIVWIWSRVFISHYVVWLARVIYSQMGSLTSTHDCNTGSLLRRTHNYLAFRSLNIIVSS